MYFMYIADTDTKEPVLFPVTPPKFELKVNSQNETVSLINEGEVNLIKSPGLSDLTISSLTLPLIQQYPFAVYENGFKPADYYLEWLKKWKASKQPQTFILSRVSPNGDKLLFDTNMKVTIEDYKLTEDAEAGFDIKVDLQMKQYKEWGPKKLVIAKNTKGGKKKASKKKSRSKKKKKAGSYTVKSGDTLRKIARKQLNAESKWKNIYNLNKSVIEKAARSHGRTSSSTGHWIYPGTKLKLPQ